MLGSSQALATRWSGPLTLSQADEYAQAPRVAVDAQGDEAVVWQRRISSYHSTVELALRPADGGFSAPITITEAGGQNETPSVALGPHGRVLVLWATEANIQYAARELVMASWGSVGGGAFTAPRAVSGYEGGNGWMYPRAAITADGEAVAIWQGLDEHMHYATGAPGSEDFAAPRTLANPSEDLSDPVVAISPNGAAVAAWESYSELYVATRESAGGFGPTQTLETQSCAGGDINAAINDAGTAVLDWSVDWRKLAGERECEVGGTPTWLRAAYRAPGQPFGAPVNAAEMDGWSRSGGVAVDAGGRVTITALGTLLSPSSTGPLSALTRLPDGTYGEAQTIAHGMPVEEPATLAYDAAGTLYEATDTRTYDEASGSPDSTIIADTAPAGSGFAAESTTLQSVSGELDSPPSLAAAGEGHAAAAWATDVGNQRSRVELSQLERGEPPGAGKPPPASPEEPPDAGKPPPASPEETPAAGGQNGATQGDVAQQTSHTQQPSATAQATTTAASGAPAGTGPSNALRAAGTPHTLLLSGPAGRARAVLVELMRNGHVARSVRARLHGGRFRAILSLAGLPAGRYRLQILRRGERWERSEQRSVSVP